MKKNFNNQIKMLNKTNNYKSHFLYLIIFLFLLSCNNNKVKDEFYTLYYSLENSTKVNQIPFDSLVIKNYKRDSIMIKKHISKNNYRQSFYFYKDGSFYERREIVDILTSYYMMDTLLMFSKKDTTYKYIAKHDDFIVIINSVALSDGQDSINGDNNIYISKIHDLYENDTVSAELYYYDKNYRIFKFAQTRYSDTCVYLRKNE